MFVQDAWQWECVRRHADDTETLLRLLAMTRWQPVGGWSMGDGGEPTPPAKSIAPCRSTLALPPQTQCHPPSPSSTRFAGVWPAFHESRLLAGLSWRPGEHKQCMTNAFVKTF